MQFDLEASPQKVERAHGSLLLDESDQFTTDFGARTINAPSLLTLAARSSSIFTGERSLASLILKLSNIKLEVRELVETEFEVETPPVPSEHGGSPVHVPLQTGDGE